MKEKIIYFKKTGAEGQEEKVPATTAEPLVSFSVVRISALLMGGKQVRDHVLVVALVTPTGWCGYLSTGS